MDWAFPDVWRRGTTAINYFVKNDKVTIPPKNKWMQNGTNQKWFIQDDAITAAKITTDAVGSGGDCSRCSWSSELADNAVDANAIATNAVTTAKINADAVTDKKLVKQQST